MDGKIFLYSEINPSKSSQFIFDLQRFTGDATAETGVYKIGNQYYSTLQKALTDANASTSNVTIELLKDDDVSSKEITIGTVAAVGGSTTTGVIGNQLIINNTNSNVTITIKGNGHTIKGVSNASIKNVRTDAGAGDVELNLDNPQVMGFYLKSGNVTFDSVELTEFGDKDYCNMSGYTPIQTNSSYSGKLTLNNVNINKFSRQAIAICSDKCSFEITGCTVACDAEGVRSTGTTPGTNCFDFMQQGIEIRKGSGSIKNTAVSGFLGEEAWDVTYAVAGILVAGSGNVSVSGCTLTGGKTTLGTRQDFPTGIYNSGNGTVTISDTTINSQFAICVDNNGNTNVNSGNYTGKIVKYKDNTTATLAVSGGVFNDSSPVNYERRCWGDDLSGTYTTSDVSKLIGENVDYQVLDNRFYVGESILDMTVTPYLLYIDNKANYYTSETAFTTAKADTSNVASIGDNKYFTSLEKALSFAKSGDTIKLLKDTVENVSVYREVTIDLNNFKITGSGDTPTITVNKNGNLTIIDSGTGTGGSVSGVESAVKVEGSGLFNLKGGTLTATNNSANIVELAEVATAESSASFTMSGGNIQSSATASGSNVPAGVFVGKNRFFNMLGGAINTFGLGIASKGQNVQIKGGSIKGKTGIKMLAGALNVLGGKIRGLANAAGAGGSNVAEDSDGSVTPLLTNDDGFGTLTEGNGIEIASSSDSTAVTVNVGQSGQNADIDIGGSNSALNIGGNNTGDTINLYASKLSSVTDDSDTAGTGSSINYQNNSAKLTLDGVILDSKVETTGTEPPANVTVTSVAMSSDAKSGTTNTAFTNDLTGTGSLDGNTYSTKGDVITKNQVATIDGINYSSLNKAIGAAEANSEITLSKSQSISEQIKVSKALTIKFGSNTLTYNGEGNAALKVTSGEVTIDKAEAFKDSKGKVLGIAIASNANVYVPTPSNSNVAETDDGVVEPADAPEGYSDFTTVAKAKIVTNDGEEVYFMTLEQAMEQLNPTEGETVVAITDGTLTYPAEGTTQISLSGLANNSEVSIGSEKVVSIAGNKFGENGVTVNSNAGGYKFNLSGSFEANATNAKFTGAATADTIENAIASLTIDGGAGDDSIKNSGENASIVGGDGSDIIENSGANATLDGGLGDDLLRGSSLSADKFIYTAGKDTIEKFGKTDIISLGSGLTPITDVTKFSVTDKKFVFTFDNNNILTVNTNDESTDSVSTVSIQSGDNTYYYYTKDSVKLNDTDISLTAANTSTSFDGSTYTTVDASAVAQAISIKGGSNNNYLVASAKKGGTLDGGAGDNSLVGGTDGSDVFVHNSGSSDSIYNYTFGTDAVSLTGTYTALPMSFTNVNYDGTDYVISLGASNDSLTFKGTSEFSLKTGEDNAASIYTYKSEGTIALNSTAANGITLGSSLLTSKSFDGTKGDNTVFVSINAAEVDHEIKVTGNDNANYIVASNKGGTLLGGSGNDTLVAQNTESAISTFLNGGEGDDSLVGGNGKDTFIYSGGADRIKNYGTGDIVNVTSGMDPKKAVYAADGNNISLTFGDDDSNKLIFESIGGATVSLKSGKNNYTYTKNYAATDTSITLAAGYSSSSFEGTAAENKNYSTIDASAVSLTGGISIVGNDNNNYSIVGSTVVANSLSGGKGNDFLIGNSTDSVNDVFSYTGGKDVIQNFNANDSLSITDDLISSITKARATSSKLVFTKDKDNTITFKATDEVEAPTIVSVASGGYLTKDGYVSGNGFSLFGSAKGKIDLADDLYKDANITSVDASAVKKQGVTLVGGTSNGTFTFAEKNKKRDAFEYGGDGSVTISGYESGRDRINLGSSSITGFEITNSEKDVNISLSNGKAISLVGAKGSEVLIHQSTSKGNSYSKMVFNESGIIYDKSSTSATSATLWSNAGDYSASGKIKKVTADGFAGHSITANPNVNTFIDASLAGSAGVSLIGGKKNDKFTGSAGADMFVYTGGGKDVIQNFGAGDQISLGAGFDPLYANITSNSSSIKFKFNNKNTLTIKPTKGEKLDGKLTVNSVEHTYYKDAIVTSSGTASLTSKFGGTFKVKDYSGVATVNGSLSTNRLTIKGTTGAETLMGGTNKTTFKGGGGADSLVGGSGADTFFYAKGDKDTVTIADFDFTKDNLKIANGTIKQISTVSGGIQFAMKTGKTINDPTVGCLNVTSSATYTKSGNSTTTTSTDLTSDTAKKVLIKANNTYYWFANEAGTDVKGDSFAANALITSDKKISSSKASGYDVIELNYSTNLVKAGVAVAVKDANLPLKS